MDYNKLRTFLVVADRGGVVSGARALHRTPSAVSQQLRVLEEDLGFSLFVRDGRSLTPTREGEALRGPVRAALEQVDAAVSTVRSQPATEHPVRIGSVAEFFTSTLAPRLGPLRAAHPGISIEVTLSTSREVERALLADQLDVGLLVTFQNRRLFERVPCASVRCIVVASPAYLERAGTLRTVRRVAEADVVDVSKTGAWFATWLRKNDPAAAVRFAERRPAIAVPSHEGVRLACLGGGGVGLVPRAAVAADLESRRLVELVPSAKPVVVTAELAVVRRAWRRPPVDELVAFFRNQRQRAVTTSRR